MLALLMALSLAANEEDLAAVKKALAAEREAALERLPNEIAATKTAIQKAISTKQANRAKSLRERMARLQKELAAIRMGKAAPPPTLNVLSLKVGAVGRLPDPGTLLLLDAEGGSFHQVIYRASPRGPQEAGVVVLSQTSTKTVGRNLATRFEDSGWEQVAQFVVSGIDTTSWPHGKAVMLPGCYLVKAGDAADPRKTMRLVKVDVPEDSGK